MARLDETVELNYPNIWVEKVRTATGHGLRKAELLRREHARKAKRRGNYEMRRNHILAALLLRVTRVTGYTFWEYPCPDAPGNAVLVGRYARLFFKKDFVVLEHKSW